MRFVDRILRPDGLPDDPRLATAVSRWREAAPQLPTTLLEYASFLVVDVDVTGTDRRRDRLTGIGTVAVGQASIMMASLRHTSHPNTDAMGGAGFAQEARAHDSRLAECLLREAAGRIPVFFRADFALGMLAPLLDRTASVSLADAPVIDLAWVLPGLLDDQLDSSAPLQAWLDFLHIELIREHHALCDAYAIAQLLLAGLAAAQARSRYSLGDLYSMESSTRELYDMAHR